MTNFSETVSHMIESQFPAIYREEGAELVAFVKAYYEFLEKTDSYNVKMSRKMFGANDIDDSLEEFVTHFKQKYLADLPFSSSTDTRFMIKHIMDLYRSKGSTQSLELFMKLVFDEEVDVYLPGQDILRPSDSEWYRPIYLEVSRSSRTRSFVNKQVTGSKSGATAFVEGIVTKRIAGKLIDVLYLSGVRGQFEFSERISDDGNLVNAPIINGSLTNINITLGGRDNQIGDVFDVVSPDGTQGKIRITAIEDATGRVDFEIVEGGYGYTNTSDGTSSDVYVADAMISVNNANLEYRDYETVVQRIETITTLSATDINGASPGDFLVGVNGSGLQVANGVVLSVANTDANGSIITTNSANSIITVQAVGDTTFGDQKLIATSGSTAFAVGEILEEESITTLEISSVVGSFLVGQKAIQYKTDPVSNTIIDTYFGTITTANATHLVLEPSWGVFDTNLSVSMESNPAVTASVDSVSVDPSEAGARATITNVDGANVVVAGIFGAFTTTKEIRGTTTKLTDTISSVSTTGAADLWLNGVSSANGIVDTVANNHASGIVVGQNTSTVGIYGNNAPFIFVDGKTTLETSRDFRLNATATNLITDSVADENVWTPGGPVTTTQLDLNILDSFKGVRVASGGSTWNRIHPQGVSYTAGETYIVQFWYMAGTSGRVRCELYSATPAMSAQVRGPVGNVATDPPTGASLEVVEQIEVVPGVHKVSLKFVSNYNITASFGVGPDTATVGDDVIVLGMQIEHNDTPSFYVPTYGESATRTDNVRQTIKEIYTGVSADFNVGFLENTETVSINTDLVGANNISEIPFIDIKLSGEGSGIGFLDSVTIDSPGTMYSNGSVVTFTGGGYAGGDPFVSAEGTITTDGAGAITSITITVPGEGYFVSPTAVLPATSGTAASVTPVVDYGYGFPKLPDGDEGTTLVDALTNDNFTIGTIASLTQINPGQGYNVDPFVKVRNKYIESFNRRDMILTLSGISGSYTIGESLTQDIGGGSTAKGVVKSFINNGDGTGTLYVKRTAFNVSFIDGVALTGTTSGATATVDLAQNDVDTRALGDNAVITGTVIAANGIATGVEVIDSGYGYLPDGSVSLERDGFPFIITGDASVINQGISEGYWRTTTSHLNSEKKIQDSKYYQEYSYDVISGITLNRYKNILKDVLHVSGNEIFGSIVRKTKLDANVTVANTSVTIS